MCSRIGHGKEFLYHTLSKSDRNGRRFSHQIHCTLEAPFRALLQNHCLRRLRLSHRIHWHKTLPLPDVIPRDRPMVLTVRPFPLIHSTSPTNDLPHRIRERTFPTDFVAGIPPFRISIPRHASSTFHFSTIHHSRRGPTKPRSFVPFKSLNAKRRYAKAPHPFGAVSNLSSLGYVRKLIIPQRGLV